MSPLVLLAIAAATQANAASPANKPPTRSLPETVARGLSFLAEQGPAFQNKKGCITCHHGPMTVWAQREPAQRGFNVDRQSLDAFEKKLLTKLTNGRKGADKRQWRHTQSAFFTLAQPDDWKPAESSNLSAALIEGITSAQLEDGSWKAAGQFKGQRRSKGEAHLLQTMWNSLALARLESHDPSIAPLRKKAVKWIRNAPEPVATDSRAVRLLVEHRLGEESHADKRLSDLLDSQNDDGSWGWESPSKGDAWATGQTLYVLSFLGDKVPSARIGRAQNYLAVSQSNDGSWATPTKLNPSKHKQEISTFFGTAWSVLGLARTVNSQ